MHDLLWADGSVEYFRSLVETNYAEQFAHLRVISILLTPRKYVRIMK